MEFRIIPMFLYFSNAISYQGAVANGGRPVENLRRRDRFFFLTQWLSTAALLLKDTLPLSRNRKFLCSDLSCGGTLTVRILNADSGRPIRANFHALTLLTEHIRPERSLRARKWRSQEIVQVKLKSL
ncbi:MAG: hypothetical protein AAYR33_05925 [Acetobacteraceae bacterium]